MALQDLRPAALGHALTGEGEHFCGGFDIVRRNAGVEQHLDHGAIVAGGGEP